MKTELLIQMDGLAKSDDLVRMRALVPGAHRTRCLCWARRICRGSWTRPCCVVSRSASSSISPPRRLV